MTLGSNIARAVASGSAARAIRALDGDPIPGSEWHEAVIRAGKLGLATSTHGALDRWDWGVTFATMEQAFRRHERMVALAKGLTPEQVAALWTTDDPRAAALRKVLR